VNGVVAAVVAVVVLFAITGYLAAVETVVTRIDVVRALRLREQGDRGSEPLVWVLEHRASTLNALLVASVLVRTLLAATAAVLGWELFADGIEGALIAVLVVAAVTLTGAEVAPRTLTLRSLEQAGCLLAPSAKVLSRALGPVASLAVAVGRALVPRREGVAGPYASDEPDDDHAHVDEAEQDEELEPEERAMIRSIFELRETRVREIMVPRPDLVTVSEEAPFDEVVAVVTEHGVSRIPVHDAEDGDTIVGVVYAKDLLKRVAADRRRRWGDLVRRPTFVPESKRCDELLRELQDATVHLAMVVDEYGDLVGLVTIEDILEEIVGEIVDEHDHEEPLVETLEEGGWRIDARLDVDDLNQLLGAELPVEGWDTVGGLVFGTLGRVPLEDEVIELEGVQLTVERVQGRRVAKVRVVLLADAEAESSG
jgi:CBS domain containing-hemolysin-like protein